MKDVLLEVDRLTMRFGGLVAIDALSFKSIKSDITAIIGPNGAGKTTLFNCLTGFYKPNDGSITFNGLEEPIRLDKIGGHRVVTQARIVRTFQNIRLFPRMTLLENLIVAQHNRLMQASWYTVGGLFGFHSHRNAELEAIKLACYWLEQTGLSSFADVEAGTLPYGIQRRAEIARAMCTKPLLLCLDEPAAGLNPHESSVLNTLLLHIREREGISILLIEHDMSVVMEVSDRVVVLDHGKLIADGTPREIQCDPVVINAYLGDEDEEPLQAHG